MAKMTLLEIVQSTMVTMNRASVSAISDLEESELVANIAKDIYFQIVTENDWSHTKTITQLGSVADNTRPNYLLLPENLLELNEVRYNVRTTTDTKDVIKTIPFTSPSDFLHLTQARDSSATNTTQVTDFGGAQYQIYNDTAPTCWTSFDDEYIAFDSYDSVVDDCLAASKSTAIIVQEPSFTLEDDFVPDLPSKMFPYYLSRVKESTRAYLHGEIIPIDSNIARNHRANLYQTESRSNVIKRLNYGRK